MSFCVLDASFAFPWLFEDEATAEADMMLTLIGNQGAVVPALWFTEIANGLGMAERRKRITSAGIREAISLLEALPLIVEGPELRRFGILLDLTRAHRLTAYDATYLELAVRRGLPLAPGDKELRTAATRVGVVLVKAGP